MPHTFHQIGRLTALLLIVFSLIFVSGCGGSSDIGSISGSGDSGTPAASPAPGTVSPSIVAMENQVKVLINAERAKAGKPPLDWNDSPWSRGSNSNWTKNNDLEKMAYLWP